ncbi:flagellar hook-associated protein FlgK (plasmid) [Aristophania vespae]|uniref:Flagellar hook-associated protein 1 n=2 Tax=Aristophania vespae TaxID=2697033 RepID=A0A6P1NDX2_9PROT|nr:flagellar hook-associated protein FlgK [Aristophania vespae]QHI96516.1 flagellar hook-associated protein FlgK [Aristophania vespae]UMM64798.1 Flagellar hook-associated protein 1 [Aristophania vespae]
MGLGLPLNIATGGLQAIESQLETVSKNITNASTEGYVSENANVTSVVSSGKGVGVKVGHNSLVTSPALQSALYAQNAKVGGLTTKHNSLGAVSSVQGTTGSNADSNSDTIGTLPNYLQKVSSSLVKLSNTPSDSGALSTVISNAKALVNDIHTLSSVYQNQRQNAHDAVVSTVSTVNTDLTTIGDLTRQIMSQKASGNDTSDLENKRFEFMSDLSEKLGVSFTEKANGDMIITTQDGTKLPTRPEQMGLATDSQKLPSSTWPLSTSKVGVSPAMYHSSGETDGGIPGIMLDGKDITSHLTDGTLGANITLRDETYPQMQAQLDSFSYTLINRFNDSGLPLFTNGSSQPISKDPTKTAPDGLIDLSSALSVDQKYIDQPSLLTTDSDGNTGVSTNINKVISKGLSDAPEATSGDLEAPSSGLGPNGSFSTGYSGAQGLNQLATALTTNQAQTVSDTKEQLSTEGSVRTTLKSQVASVSGVNVNNQMALVITLQNSYAANAKVVSAVQSMFTALINAV